MDKDTAVSILTHRFQSPTQGATEEYVEALHVIIGDVIEACALAAKSFTAQMVGGTEEARQFAGDCMADDITMTVNDYVVNHYGIEEFGL